ncbi:MAG: PilZ domain-containing protein [Nitrospirota bacterium]
MQDFEKKRKFERVPYDDTIKFSVLFTEAEDLKKIDVEGKIINTSQAGIGIVTNFPLEPGHVLQWVDKHQKDKLHMASVRWSQELEDYFRAGAMLI